MCFSLPTILFTSSAASIKNGKKAKKIKRDTFIKQNEIADTSKVLSISFVYM